MATKLDDNLDDPLYIYPVPKGLVTNCPVCFVSLYQDPFVNGECGHHLCGPCSKRLKYCPECRVCLKTHPDKSLQRVLKSLSVYCNKKNEGCEWEGELGDLQHHQENCEHAVIPCATCDLEGPRHQIFIHQREECIFRIVSCEYCYHHCSLSDMDSHYDICSEYIIQCSECYESITRGYEKTHKNEVCPLAHVKCVAFQYGCQWEGHRRAMDDHVKDNVAVHFNLCLQQGSKNEEALASCKDVIKQLESEVKKKNQEITSLHQKLESEVKKKNQEIILLRQKVSTLEQNNQCLLKTQIPSMENEMKRKIAVWQDAAENDLRKELTDYIDECLESEEETDDEDDEDDDYDSDSDIVKQKPTFSYELNHFIKSKNKDKDVLSPSFYANGYHMRLRIHPNGYGRGEGSHLSVYVCLLQGIHDHIVSWPFRGEVIIELLHNANGQPHRRVVKYEHDTPVDFSTVAKSQAKGNGFPKFIAHSSLNNYLSKSTLCFEVFVSCQ